ncbi:hypothetical protein GUJ93_ZPchr0001g32074 [Zizania palustris]|uniref:Uncharacterized protein n=1 Tax=Zizania palustris TaxID=103762 RepID=A0A8J5V295_ZIZPA|nr:hypothetical protein GUJ93_ZPchr0001g32074 [Zizania palustris]
MEPKKTSAQPQPHMESKKSPRRGAAAAAADDGAETPLSSLFHGPSHGAKGKEDLYSILFKGPNGTAQAGTADGKSQWTPAKSRTKDNKQLNQYDSVDTNPQNPMIIRWTKRILPQILMATGGKVRFTTKQSWCLSLGGQGVEWEGLVLVCFSPLPSPLPCWPIKLPKSK